jgi:hypothetical protein
MSTDFAELRALLDTALARITELEEKVADLKLDLEIIEEDLDSDHFEERQKKERQHRAKDKQTRSRSRCGCDEWKTCFECAVKV